jgi:LDH2 family malate/lactate/ureidoglycolate dehydrogenase
MLIAHTYRGLTRLLAGFGNIPKPIFQEKGMAYNGCLNVLRNSAKNKEKTMQTDVVTVPWQALRQYTQDVFEKVGLSPQEAAIEADVLVWANLRGIDSHGVRAIPRYVKMAQDGHYRTDAQIETIYETPALLVIDGDHAFGPVITVQAMHQVIEKARRVGIAWAFLRNITHQGAIGYYALMAAQNDMAGLAWVCSPPNTAPYGASARGVHNSPIAIAVPGHEHPPLVLDMATSVAAYGKLNVAMDYGKTIPETWALDKNGHPTSDPHLAAMLAPSGGYKGSGLALMFEALSSLVVGVPLLAPNLLSLDNAAPLGTQNGVIAAVDIGAITNIERYKSDVDELVRAIKDLPRADGFEEIFVPGEPEDRCSEVRLRDGIPLPTLVARDLGQVAQDLGVDLPEALRGQ